MTFLTFALDCMVASSLGYLSCQATQGYVVKARSSAMTGRHSAVLYFIDYNMIMAAAVSIQGRKHHFVLMESHTLFLKTSAFIKR